MTAVCLISLLVWDSPRYLDNLLANLEAFPPGGPFHLRILDQGSGPATIRLLEEYVKGRTHVSVERLVNNIGYSAGHNRNYAEVSKMLDFGYFVTINNDLAFGEAGWLQTMVRAMEADPRAAVGGPVCYKAYPTHIAPATREQKAAGDFLFVNGSVAIIRAAAVRRFGLFDEVFTPAYWEDADMCLRYARFGMRHIWIDIPMIHGYLGEAGRVNQEKYQELDARFGDFRTRNQVLFVDRWGTNRDRYPAEGDLRRSFPQLYIP